LDKSLRRELIVGFEAPPNLVWSNEKENLHQEREEKKEKLARTNRNRKIRN